MHSESTPKGITLTVNDRPVTVVPGPGETLLDTLRERLGQTDVKRGCDEGACGACTVVVDGRAVPSCLLLTATLSGCRVTTAAGLAHDPLAQRISQALGDARSVQCGFCVSGLLVTAWSILSRGIAPDRDAWAKELSGNVCRCGAYALIIDALMGVS